jgi:hypothetical protein
VVTVDEIVTETPLSFVDARSLLETYPHGLIIKKGDAP